MLAFIGSLQAFDLVMVMTAGRTCACDRRHLDAYVQQLVLVAAIRLRQRDRLFPGRSLPDFHRHHQQRPEPGRTQIHLERRYTDDNQLIKRTRVSPDRGLMRHADLSVVLVTDVFAQNERGNFGRQLLRFAELANMAELQRRLSFRALPQYLSNSVIVTGTTMLTVILLSAMVAFAISRFKWQYRQLVTLIFLLGMMIPMQATLLPLMIIFKNVHILNTRSSLIFPYIAFSTPIAVFILSGFMSAIPSEIEESAIIDGASIYRIFASIIIPISVPPVMTVCILTFITIWNEYILAATFISSEKLKTLPVRYLYLRQPVFRQLRQNRCIHGSWRFPVILVYFILSDKITKGMVAGAVKG